MQIEIRRILVVVLLIAAQLCCGLRADSCSMFKITRYGKTMVGNNEDAWREQSHIWFETGAGGKYGAAYVGHDDLFPQGGINEAGLVYDGFSVMPRKLKPTRGKLQITPKELLVMIMQQCSTVEEVKRFADQYDRSFFNKGMMLFVDKGGRHLVMEVDTIIIGDDKQYVLSNFCPSLTPDPAAVKIARYQRGRKFISHEGDTSLAYCVAAMDTMHECRPRFGDGTSYTTIYDLTEGIIHLYFYHDYKHEVRFRLKDELAKGNHVLSMAQLFPRNAEYVRFLQHKTPLNDHRLLLFCLFAAAFLVFGGFYAAARIARGLFKKQPTGEMHIAYLWVLPFALDIALVYYLFKLLTVQQIYYFNVPYKETGNILINAAGYLPLVLCISLIPITILNARALQGRRIFPKIVLTLHTAVYIVLASLFYYWGLLNVI